MESNKRQSFIALLAHMLGVKVNFADHSGLPMNLVLVRHGESEGNVAVRKSKNNDDSAFDEDFLSRHSRTWRLTDRGVWQATQAGIWLEKNGLATFDHYYVSTYDRAKETAYHLDLKDAKWHRPKVMLRERDRGRVDVFTIRALREKYPKLVEDEEKEPYLIRYPGGESLADVELRARHIHRTLERECSNQDALIVSHGELMWCLVMLNEGLSLAEFMKLNQSSSDEDKIHNCQILHYTRDNPFTREVTPYFSWKRSICPWDLKLSTNQWRSIPRPRLTNEDLLDSIERINKAVA